MERTRRQHAAHAPGTADGTRIDPRTYSGAGSQQWTSQNDGSLRNPASGKCLDDPDAKPESGVQLQLYDGQVWRLH